ncbi:MAG: outer membrane beta-barrel protein [Bacteroidales bacterium]|nr:outer membrane beta-barrel protein [Bacteroidales bacterium]
MRTIRILCISLLAGLIGCGVSEKSTSVKDEKKVTVYYSFRGGINQGGFTEDQTLDAISGATSMSYGFGVHPEINIRGKTIETGIDILGYNQTINYYDPDKEFVGERKFKYQELRLPITYNFKFLKNLSNCDYIHLKLGVSGGYLINKNTEQIGDIPEYSLKKFSIGPTLGLSFAPIRLSKSFKLGGYIDFYRGSRVYEDYYHNTSETGHTTYLMAGLQFKFCND